MPHKDGIDKAGSCDVYDLTLQDTLSDFIGTLLIDWGPGALAWVQYPARKNKPITELRKDFREPDFPGFLNIRSRLTLIAAIHAIQHMVPILFLDNKNRFCYTSL